MTSVDVSESCPGAPGETFERCCGPCKTDMNRKEAKHFCDDCQEYLCGACHDAHRKLKATKNHETVAVKEMPQPTEVSQHQSCIVHCGCNQNMEVVVYCENHNDVICNSCKVIKHRRCQTTSIQDKSSTYTGIRRSAILNKAKSLKEKIQQLQQERNTDQMKIKRKKDECLIEIKSFRNEVNVFLDKIEQKAQEDLEDYENHMAQQLATLTRLLRVLDLGGELLDNAQKENTKETMFAAEVKVIKTVEAYDAIVADMQNETVRTNITFERNRKLTEMMKEIDTLGSIVPKTDYKVVLGMQVQSLAKYTATMPDDETLPAIGGFRFMPNGCLILCDSSNHSIKLLDKSLEIKTSLKVTSRPWDLSVVDDNNVIFTLPESKQLQFLQVFPQMKLGCFIQLDQRCWGIEVANNEVYVLCFSAPGEGEIRVLDLQGNMKNRLGVYKDGSSEFKVPNYLTLNKSATKIYVSDYEAATITCMAVTGDIIFKYKDDKLRRPESLFVDANDNVFVCDRIRKAVHVITADGEKYKFLLAAEDAMYDLTDSMRCLSDCCLHSIAFRDTDNTLALSCIANSDILCFRLSH